MIGTDAFDPELLDALRAVSAAPRGDVITAADETNPGGRRGRTIVTVPVKNEADLLGPCLRALIHQSAAAFDEILVLINNSSDRSAAIAEHLARAARVPLLVADVVLPPDQAHAGGARRLAMEWAAARAGEEGILFTTDADGVVPPDWLAINLAAIAAGAEAVAGRALLDPADEQRLPRELREADARECTYAALLDEIDARLDPDPADPLPRHDEHSGASIAVTRAAYRRAGGIPRVRSSEDRGFFAALRRVDARIRHAPDAAVTVSGRIEGRADGGMADTIRRRMIATDAFLDSRLEPVRDVIARIVMRKRSRLIWSRRQAVTCGEIQRFSAAAGMPAARFPGILDTPYFGTFWAAMEAECPQLRRRLVPAATIGAQIAAARGFLATIDATAQTGQGS